MYPEIFSIGPVTVYSYGVLLAASYLLGLRLAMSRAKRWGLDAHRVLDLGIYIIIAALVGAKIMLLVVDFDQFRSPGDLLGLFRSGGVFYGGLVAAVATSWWFFRKHRLPVWNMTDIMAPSIAFGHAIGRLGCFSAGCCFGKPTSAFWGVTFTNPYAREISGVPLEVSLHPTQLYEAGSEFVIFLVLLWLLKRKQFDGQVFWAYVALYALVRFNIEFFRGDQRGFVFDGALSTSQFIGMLMLAAAIVGLSVLRRRPRKKTA